MAAFRCVTSKACDTSSSGYTSPYVSSISIANGPQSRIRRALPLRAKARLAICRATKELAGAGNQPILTDGADCEIFNVRLPEIQLAGYMGSTFQTAPDNNWRENPEDCN